MRQKCEYCGNWIDDTDAVCPHCNGPNAHMVVSGEGVPKTIEELQEFCKRHNLPLQQMRFFIGENYTKPKAFGIYRDGLDVVVYKNKADGSRAVRYRGKDEAYAVNEIYQKMKSEIALQRKSAAAKRSEHASQEMKKARRKGLIAKIVAVVGCLMMVIGIGAVLFAGTTSRGYYDYNGTQYYYQSDSWYVYDTANSSWEHEYDPPSTLTENADDYWEGRSYDSSYGTSDFSESVFYDDGSSSSTWDDDDDWDSDWDDDDWDWDSGDSWDTGTTDWDSDW